jgi:hypothetical protein
LRQLLISCHRQLFRHQHIRRLTSIKQTKVKVLKVMMKFSMLSFLGGARVETAEEE